MQVVVVEAAILTMELPLVLAAMVAEVLVVMLE
jgi:hypothetical protein